MSSAARTGAIAGSYETRGGERVWLIAWDDRRRTPPEDVKADGDFREGQRVRLTAGRLEASG